MFRLYLHIYMQILVLQIRYKHISARSISGRREEMLIIGVICSKLFIFSSFTNGSRSRLITNAWLCFSLLFGPRGICGGADRWKGTACVYDSGVRLNET